MARPTALAFCAVIALQGVAHAEDQDLGRLFFTPERRAALDRQRHVDAERAPVVEGGSLTLNGVVRRSSGKSTVWINGVPHDDPSPTSEVQSRVDSHDPGRVTLKAGDDPAASLKVGESIDRGMREEHDGLAGGSVTVLRSGEPPKPRP